MSVLTRIHSIDRIGPSRLVYSSIAPTSQGSFVLPMEKILSLYIYWNPSPELLPWNIPFLNRPILWYGFFFALGFFFAYWTFQELLKKFLHPYKVSKKQRAKIVEKLGLYVILGTIIGARLGDVLFYQSPGQYVHDPLGIFRFWEGGLASHGGIAGILLSLWIFCLQIKKKYPMLTWVAMLDLLCIPGLLAGGFIRIGNFFNQEIVGTGTTMPWGVIFGQPADGSASIPRHPVQLYEALCYFAFFAFLLMLRSKNPKMSQLGKTSGLFFIGTFVFRFLVEFFKSHQSALVSGSALLDMGQWLSIPLIAVGIFLFFRHENRLGPGSIKRH